MKHKILGLAGLVVSQWLRMKARQNREAGDRSVARADYMDIMALSLETRAYNTLGESGIRFPPADSDRADDGSLEAH